MRWLKTLSRVVGAPLLLSGLISLYTQGEWFAQSAWMIVPAYGCLAALILGLFSFAARDWRLLRRCALVVSFLFCFVVGLVASGRLVFAVHRAIVQRSSERLVPGIEEYRRRNGMYPEELHQASLQEPSSGSASAIYFRDEDGSFGFAISDPGIAGQSYAWDSNTRTWRDHYEPGWIF